MRHHLKTEEPYWSDVLDGKKTFEVRRNDRQFAVGDVLDLHRWMDGRDTHISTEALVTYVLPGGQFGIDPEYVVLGIECLVTP